MGNSFRELQHCNTATEGSNKSFVGFVNRNQIFLPLQRQIDEAEKWALRIKIAKVKSGNCEH